MNNLFDQDDDNNNDKTNIINNNQDNYAYKNTPRGEKKILKERDQLTLSDYDKLMLTKQYDKLYKMGKEATSIAEKHKYESRIYNLSLNEIAKLTAKTIMDILNDLVLFINQEDKTLQQFVMIFISEDRLIYVGITIIIIAFILYFIDIPT